MSSRHPYEWYLNIGIQMKTWQKKPNLHKSLTHLLTLGWLSTILFTSSLFHQLINELIVADFFDSGYKNNWRLTSETKRLLKSL